MLALEGDERLSGNSKSSSGREQLRSGSPDKKIRKDRAGTVGRALQRLLRHQQGLVVHALLQPHAHVHAGQQDAVGVGESRRAG